jgi:rhodanese-related sulfurtransferase
MKAKVMAAAAVSIMGMASLAFALTAAEEKVVQQAADTFLSNIPAGEYHIMADKLLERINSGKNDFVLVDVRIPKDKTFDQGHLPGAIHISFKDVARPENLAKLPKDKDIIVYCNTGHEENKALTVLRLLGYRAYALKWGYMAWKSAPPTGMTLKAIEGSIVNNYPLEK